MLARAGDEGPAAKTRTGLVRTVFKGKPARSEGAAAHVYH